MGRLLASNPFVVSVGVPDRGVRLGNCLASLVCLVAAGVRITGGGGGGGGGGGEGVGVGNDVETGFELDMNEVW